MNFPHSKFSSRLLKCTRTGALAASFFVAAAAAHAQLPLPITVYNTDFDTDAYTTVAGVRTPSTYAPSGSLSGSPAYVDPTTQLVPTDTASQWDTNDPTTNAPLYNVGQDDYEGTLHGYGSDTGSTNLDQVAYLGGLTGNAVRPGHQTVYDYRSISSNLNVTSSTALQTFATAGFAPILNLSVDMDILSSDATGSLSRSDSFGFSFQTTAGNGATNVFSIRFTPNGTTGTDTTKYNIALFNSAGTKIGANLLAVNVNSMYHLNIGAIASGANAGEVTLSLQSETNTYTLIGSPVGATAFDATDINLASLKGVSAISPTWIIADPTQNMATGAYTNAGSNTLVFDNYAITAAPEPSTWMMLGLGAMGLVWRFRRKAQA